MKRIALLPVVFVAALSFACNADNRTTNDNRTIENDSTVGTTGDSVSAGDRDFVEDVAVANMAEVELGKMAMERGVSAEVKKFADMMVKDHSKAGDELKQIAMQHSIPIPAGLDEKHQDLKTKLSNAKGADFDREYMNAMVDGHQDVVDRLQTRASEDRIGDDKGSVKPERSDNPTEAALNEWSATALPTVRHHLDEAKRINDGLGRTLTKR
jgi:putative membrane protein